MAKVASRRFVGELFVAAAQLRLGAMLRRVEHWLNLPFVGTAQQPIVAASRDRRHLGEQRMSPRFPPAGTAPPRLGTFTPPNLFF